MGRSCSGQKPSALIGRCRFSSRFTHPCLRLQLSIDGESARKNGKLVDKQPLHRPASGRRFPIYLKAMQLNPELSMVYSYTQIAQYLRCPRSYRHRYLDGWREKETRAAMVFGRCFENALGAYFREEDCGAVFFRQWEAYRDAVLEYKKGETWDRLLHQGIHLLELFARDNRVRVGDPQKHLQIQKVRLLGGARSLCRIWTPLVRSMGFTA
jgi:hypothetical protein